MVESLDSYYSHVADKVALVDPAQKFCGIVQARDWPQTQPVEGALYLLTLTDGVPVGGTESQILYECLCQWVWILVGENLSSDKIGAYRGDRYRQNMRIISNLRQGHFPSFCAKKSYQADAQSGVLTVTEMSPESVWWSRPRFMPQMHQEAGLIYGACSVRVYFYEEVNAAVNQA